MSLWWSFTLTAFGAAGIFLTYRSYTAYLGPAIGISIQLVWVAYAIASQQWWFIMSALLYGGSHLYGIRKRRRERSAGESPEEPAQIPNRYRTAPRRPREPSREIDLEIFAKCCNPPKPNRSTSGPFPEPAVIHYD